jgi:DNA mismatch repair protein MutH
LSCAALRYAGWTLDELARAQGCSLPVEPIRDKGFVGRVLERAFGLLQPMAATTDFHELGIELKTLPLARTGQPRESTFVCHLALSHVADTAWEQSRVAQKLARVLFVPIESMPGLELAQRRVGRAFLWSASLEEASVLRADYEEIASRIADGQLERLDARVGVALQVRPKGAHGGVRVRALDGEGGSVLAQPRAFYLRASFTAGLVRNALREG